MTWKERKEKTDISFSFMNKILPGAIPHLYICGFFLKPIRINMQKKEIMSVSCGRNAGISVEIHSAAVCNNPQSSTAAAIWGQHQTWKYLAGEQHNKHPPRIIKSVMRLTQT